MEEKQKDNSENQKEEENNDFNINNDKSNPESQFDNNINNINNIINQNNQFDLHDKEKYMKIDEFRKINEEKEKEKENNYIENKNKYDDFKKENNVTLLKIIKFFEEFRYMNDKSSDLINIIKIFIIFMLNIFIYFNSDLYTLFLYDMNIISYSLLVLMITSIFIIKFVFLFKKTQSINITIIFLSVVYYLTFIISFGITSMKNEWWGFGFYLFACVFNLNIFII